MELTPYLQRRILAMHRQGFIATRIADEHGLSTAAVRGFLRKHQLKGRKYNKAVPGLVSLTEAELVLMDHKRLMIKAGYDPDVVEANFG